MAEDLKLRVVTTADSKGLTEAARDVEKLEGKTKELGESFDDSAESSDHLTKALDGQSDEMAKAQVEARKLNDEIAKSTQRVKELQTEVIESGNDKTIRKQLSDERSWLSELQRIREDMSRTTASAPMPILDTGATKAQSMTEALRLLEARIATTKVSISQLGIEFARSANPDIGKELGSQRSLLGQLNQLRKEIVAEGMEAGSAFSKAINGAVSSGLDLLGPLKLVLIPGAIALAAEFAPIVGGVIGGVISGGIGTAAMAAGLYGASQDGKVQKAAQELGSSLKDQIFGGTMFVQPAIDALALLDHTVETLGIGETLAKTSGSVTTIAQGVSDLVTNAWPGFDRAVSRSGPMADAAAEGMGDLGAAVGYAVDKISESPGAIKGIEFAFKGLSTVIMGVGNVVNWLENRFDSFVHVAVKYAAVSEGVAAALRYNGMAGAFGSAVGGWEDLSSAAVPALGALSLITGSTDDYADAAKKAADATHAVTDAWETLHGKVASADSALLSAKQSVDAVKDAFKENGKSIDGNSEAALKNRIALQDAARSAADAAQQYYIMTGDAAGANKIMVDQKKAAEDATGAVGKQKDAIHALADELFKLPPSIFVTVNFKYNIPNTGLGSQIQANLLREDRYDGRASGGPVMAGVPYTINERGSETVTFPSNGTVHPANLSPMGAGGGPLNIRLTWAPTGQRLADAILEALRPEIQGRGGPVAAFR